MDRLGIECLSTFGMAPADHVRLAALLGCGHVSLNPGGSANPLPPATKAPWRDDARVRREVTHALDDTGVRVSLVEGFALLPDQPDDAHLALLDLAADLGARAICAVSLDRDAERTHAGFARLAEQAAERGLIATTEVGAGTIRDWARAQAAIAAVGHRGFALVVDTMHFFRKGGTVADIAAAPGSIAHVPLCDVPMPAVSDNYMEEALYERRAPGDGDLPLAAFLAQVPGHVPLGIEAPVRSEAEAGVPPRERLGRAVAQARALLG